MSAFGEGTITKNEKGREWEGARMPSGEGRLAMGEDERLRRGDHYEKRERAQKAGKLGGSF